MICFFTIAKFIIASVIKPNHKRSCHKLEPFFQIFYAKEGKHWKERLIEIFRVFKDSL